MNDLNKATFTGRVGADATLNYTPQGMAVANVRVASNEFFPGKDGEKRKITTWHRVVIWGKMAEGLAPLLLKGRRVYIDGATRTRTYEDKAGVKHTTTEVNAKEINLLDAPKKVDTDTATNQPELPLDAREVQF